MQIGLWTTGFLICCCAATVRAQEPSAQSVREARRSDIESRQRALWTLEKEAHKRGQNSRKSSTNTLAYRQFKEDYEALQIASYSLTDLVSLKTFSYDDVAKQAAEVKKRAARIRTTLVLPEAEKAPKKNEPEVRDLKAAVTDLESLVQRFATNPMFQELTVLDANHTMNARRDLDDIVKLSESIRKLAEELKK